MTELRSNIRVFTPEVRLSFANLFTARPNDQGKLKFSTALIFSKEAQETQEFKDLRAALQEVTLAKYGSQDKIPEGFKTPFRSCKNHKHHAIHGDDAVFCNVNTENQPGIVGPDGKSPITNPAGIKSGDYVRCSLNAYAYDNKSKGVTFGLGNIQLIRKGEALGSQVDAADEFGAVEGADAGGAGEDGGGEAQTAPASSLF